MAVILAISSQVVRGHVGLSAVVPALQALGHEVWPLPTILLSNHPGHDRCAGTRLKATALEAMLDALEENGWLANVDAVLSGYLPTADHVTLVADILARMRANRTVHYLCDPILGDDPKGVYIDPAAAAAIRDTLVPLADILTPNRFELAWLCGHPVTSAPEAVTAARMLPSRAVIATSVPLPGDHLGNLLVADGRAAIASVAEEAHVPHGTGDLMSGLLLGHAMAGLALDAAMARAVAGVDAAIGASVGRDELDLTTCAAAIVAAPAVGLLAA